MSGPPPPPRVPPGRGWAHFNLYERVRQALGSIPSYFSTETNIGGIAATDLFTLGPALGATIEDQVVRTLNRMRPIWDPDGKYNLYYFRRQGQTFPDVLLSKKTDTPEVLLGIELKSWYLLAKEGEPSLRFVVTADACSAQDLLVVVPWALPQVLSGSPVIFPPYVENAKFAADFRNHHWASVRKAKSSAEIRQPQGIRPYPRKSDQINDSPVSDAGGNFGRLARTSMMDEYLKEASETLLCGIPAHDWVVFFKRFAQ